MALHETCRSIIGCCRETGISYPVSHFVWPSTETSIRQKNGDMLKTYSRVFLEVLVGLSIEKADLGFILWGSRLSLQTTG